MKPFRGACWATRPTGRILPNWRTDPGVRYWSDAIKGALSAERADCVLRGITGDADQDAFITPIQELRSLSGAKLYE
ncbi:hypothetical protein D3C81_2169490 [compost metagenome]